VLQYDVHNIYVGLNRNTYEAKIDVHLVLVHYLLAVDMLDVDEMHLNDGFVLCDEVNEIA